MANVLVQESSLSDIADAIRAKNGTNNTYKPAQMAGAIRDIAIGVPLDENSTIEFALGCDAGGVYIVTPDE